jgi:hypothetical protein
VLTRTHHHGTCPPPNPTHTHRCSRWRCTTSAWTRPAPATTWA